MIPHVYEGRFGGEVTLGGVAIVFPLEQSASFAVLHVNENSWHKIVIASILKIPIFLI